MNNGLSRHGASYCTLYLARHGQTEWNEKGIIQGQMDSPLTPEGVRQAQALGEQLKDVPFDAIYSSDLSRARNTAEYALVQKKLAVRTAQALRERRYGRFEGRHKDEFNAATKKLLKLFSDLFKRHANGAFLEENNIESDDEIAARMITFLREVAVAYPGGQVLLVTHGGVIRVVMTHLGFMRHEELGFGKIGNTAYAVVHTDGVDFILGETSGIR